MPPPAVRNDHDLIRRMRAISARLRALDCAASEIPPDVVAEGDLLRAYIRRRVARVTSEVDQAAASLLGTLDTTAV